MFAGKFTEKLRLNLELPEEDIWVKGDAQRLKQIIINLLANALKFTAEGSITLGLKVLEITPAYTRLQFMVADTGVSMTPEGKARLFQRFSQADASVASRYGGTGLGLAISDQFIKLMNGQIEVESEVGKGTQFRFAIQCSTPAPEELKTSLEEVKPLSQLPQSPLPSVVELPAAAKPAIGLLILVVDDNPVNQKVLAMQLKKLGYETQLANNGKEAVDFFLSSGPFALIFMDVEMPVMNGYEATREIREKEQELGLKLTPIICTTGLPNEKVQPDAQAVGMNDVMTKPFNKENVQQMVKKWVCLVLK
jgi:CheY-like chemotaxis protein